MRKVLVSLVACLLGANAVLGQAPPPAATGLVVGSGNFFSPIVTDLDAATAFYRDGLGFAVTGGPTDGANNAPVRNMFGLPDAQLRWNIARPAGIRGGVEMVEIKKVASKALARNVQDPGAVTLVLAVRDIDVMIARLSKLGATVVTTTGGAVDVTLAGAPARMVLLRTPDGHFVQLMQRQGGATADSGDPAAQVTDVRVRLTVDDVDRALRLYRDGLGLVEQSAGTFNGTPAFIQMLGLRGGMFRQAITQVPASGLFLQFIEFKDVERRQARGDIQDPGSTRIQLQVKDLDSAAKAIVAAGGRIVSSGGMPVQLPAGRGGTIKAAVVRDPDNLFLVLIEQAPAAAAPAR
jgi:predicted enzyme related to lactoylglutathione lyase